MEKEALCQLTEDEIMDVRGGGKRFSKISYKIAGVALMIDSVVLCATCSPVIGVAAMGTGIACMEASSRVV